MARHFAFEKLSQASQQTAIRMYEDGATLAEIVEALREASGEEIAGSSLHRYLSRVAEIEKKSRQAIKRRLSAADEFVRDNPECDEAAVLRALRYEAALANRDQAVSLDLKTLVQEDRRRAEATGRMEIERAKLELDREKLEHEKRILEFKQRVAVQATQAADEVQRVVKSSGLSDEAAAQIRAKILGVAS